jgi:group I intron endonuclease
VEVVCGIYCIENIKNNKKYIGQSVDIYRRWANHKCDLNGNRHNNEHLQSAWNKYGANSFEFTIVEKCDEDLLDSREIYYIDLYDCINGSCGYNLETGGNQNKHPSEESRKKMSESHIGLQAGENHPMWGKPKSEETKRKISEAKIGKYAGENSPRYGMNHSEDTKKKIGDAIKGRFVGENHPMYGQKHSEENRKKISQSNGGINIYCLELDEIFWGAAEAEEKYNINHSNIIACCRGKRIFAGIHPTTGEQLHWAYVGDECVVRERKTNAKMVYCKELDMIFDSATDGAKYIGATVSNVTACCRGKRKSIGKHPETKVPLHWEYIENNNT